MIEILFHTTSIWLIVNFWLITKVAFIFKLLKLTCIKNCMKIHNCRITFNWQNFNCEQLWKGVAIWLFRNIDGILRNNDYYY